MWAAEISVVKDPLRRYSNNEGDVFVGGVRVVRFAVGWKLDPCRK